MQSTGGWRAVRTACVPSCGTLPSRGQRDEYGGDQIEDAAAPCPGPGSAGRGEAGPGQETPGEGPVWGGAHRTAWNRDTRKDRSPRGHRPPDHQDPGGCRPHGRQRETARRSSRASGPTTPMAPPRKRCNMYECRQRNRCFCAWSGEPSARARPAPPAVKTKGAYIRQQSPTPVTRQPQNMSQGTAVFIRERGRNMVADTAGKSTVCQAGDEGASPTSDLKTGQELVGGPSPARQPQGQTVPQVPQDRPVRPKHGAAVPCHGQDGQPRTWGQ